MRHCDRLLLAALAIGVWALVLRPATPTAHDFDRHRCDVAGDLYGKLQSTDVADGAVADDRVRIYGVRRLVVTCQHR